MNRFHIALAVSALGLGPAIGLASDLVPQRADFAAAQAELVQAIEANPALKYNPASIIVKFADKASPEAKAAALSSVSGRPILEWSALPNTQLVRVQMEPSIAVDLLNSGFVPGIEYAELDWIVSASATPNDTYYSLLWGMNNTGQTVNGDPGVAGADINAAEAWDVTNGDPNFVIGDIDSGIQLDHPDLAANIWHNPGEIAGDGIDNDGDGYVDDVYGWDFYSNDNNPTDENNHGTHTSGTIGAVGNNGIGVAGVNWQCKLAALRFLGPTGSGSTSGAISAVNYCITKGIKVSNNSWGGGGYSSTLFNAINASAAAGHVFVAAAGNSGLNIDSSPSYPASYTCANIISVAATDNNDGRASFSNYRATSVDIGAAGVNIASTIRGSGYAYMNGTSMATPHVAGLVALVYAQNPGWGYSQVKTQILSTARPVSSLAGRCVTGGVINAQAAIGGGGGGNTAPSVTISSPSEGASFNSGTSVTFTGSASDAQDGSLSAGLVWTSSLDGQIGTGASFSRSNLSIGNHTITATVTDSGGLQGAAVVHITVSSTTTPPAAPSSFNATRLSSGVAHLTWLDNSNNETRFEIQRQQRVGGTWTNTTTLNANANTTTLDDAAGVARFRYRIRSTNGAGSSSWSSWRSVNL